VPYDEEEAAATTINNFKNGDVAALLQAGIDNATVKKVLGPYVMKAANAAKKVAKVANVLDSATIAIAGGTAIDMNDFKAFAAATTVDEAIAAAKAVADKIGSFCYNDLITNGITIEGGFGGKTVTVKIVLAWD
nr:hypothetical protein [Clostridia bacterium]